MLPCSRVSNRYFKLPSFHAENLFSKQKTGIRCRLENADFAASKTWVLRKLLTRLRVWMCLWCVFTALPPDWNVYAPLRRCQWHQCQLHALLVGIDVWCVCDGQCKILHLPIGTRHCCWFKQQPQWNITCGICLSMGRIDCGAHYGHCVSQLVKTPHFNLAQRVVFFGQFIDLFRHQRWYVVLVALVQWHSSRGIFSIFHLIDRRNCPAQ